MKNLVRLLTLLASVTTMVLGQGSTNQSVGVQTADLFALQKDVASPDTRVRVYALHRVWTIGLAASDPGVKLQALKLLSEPVGSASDHIRMPAVYAIAEIANSSPDIKVKIRALELLSGPLRAEQVPIRDAAIDAVNSITSSAERKSIALTAVNALAPCVRSGNNGVRIPAINALIHAVKGSHDEAAYNAALDVLTAPLDSNAMIGGLEVRMMAVVALERIGLDASETAVKAKALGMLKAYGGKPIWEPEAKRRAEQAAAAVQESMG